mgnify:CR=1 FL=1
MFHCANRQIGMLFTLGQHTERNVKTKGQKTYLLEHSSKYNLLELKPNNNLKGLRSV